VEIIFLPKADLDIIVWKKSGQKSIQNRISKLLKDIKKNPFTGLGNPERLKHQLSGYWSREIDKKNRLIYKLLESENKIVVYSLRGHYFDK
jgi:toxin YoeB